ncbi:MAG: cache domain-containing protein, partial [Candidatus Omnitrophica bacterium]|nr:cache domain-containing protein [Candidatus Omnitrophota bacterium]
MKIAAKISVSFLVLAVILTFINSYILYSVMEDTLEREIDARLDSTANSRAAHIKTYLEMLKLSIGQLSKSVVLENFLHADEDKEAFDNALQRLKRTKEANPAIGDFLLLNKNGSVIASSNEKYIGLDRSTDVYFIAGQKRVFIKDAYYSEGTKEGLLVTSCPFLDTKTGELLGVLAAEVKLDELYKVTTDRTGLGKTGEIIIVNKYGFLITPSRFLEDTFLKQRVDTNNFWTCMLQSDPEYDHSTEPEVLFSRDYRGVPTVGAHVYMPEMQWAVLGKIDVSEGLAPLRKINNIFATTLVVTPFLVWLVGMFLAGFITRPIRKLQKGVEIVGAGNLDYKVGIGTKDEVG